MPATSSNDASPAASGRIGIEVPFTPGRNRPGPAAGPAAQPPGTPQMPPTPGPAAGPAAPVTPQLLLREGMQVSGMRVHNSGLAEINDLLGECGILRKAGAQRYQLFVGLPVRLLLLLLPLLVE